MAGSSWRNKQQSTCPSSKNYKGWKVNIYYWTRRRVMQSLWISYVIKALSESYVLWNFSHHMVPILSMVLWSLNMYVVNCDPLWTSCGSVYENKGLVASCQLSSCVCVRFGWDWYYDSWVCIFCFLISCEQRVYPKYSRSSTEIQFAWLACRERFRLWKW